MAVEPQTGDMDATQIAERHVVERYLANQLTEAEAEAFEAYVESHPEVTRQIELAARMKTGLHVLRRRGELQGALISPRSWSRHPAFLAGTAASIAAAAFLVFRFAGDSKSPMLATTLEQLRSSGSKPLALGATVTLARTRAIAPGGEIAMPPENDAATMLAELALLTGDETEHRRYAVEILRLTEGRLEPVTKLDDAEVVTGGVLRLYVRGSVLIAGAYVIRLTPLNSSAPIEFSLRVTRAAK